MRRHVLAVTIGGVVFLTLLCGAGVLQVWSVQGHALVLPGSSDVQIDRRGPFRVRVTYHLPRGQTLHSLNRYLAQQGWRRIKFPNFDRNTLSFARSGWADQVREILIVTLDARDRRLADLQFSRCFRVSSWTKCL